MDGDGTVTAEILLAIMVREWTARMLPDDADLGGRAADRALECLGAGASVSEAWREAARLRPQLEPPPVAAATAGRRPAPPGVLTARAPVHHAAVGLAHPSGTVPNCRPLTCRADTFNQW